MGSVREWNVELDDRIVGKCDSGNLRELHIDGNIDEWKLHSDMHEDGLDYESSLYDQWA